MPESTEPSPREKALAAISDGTGKSREQAEAFLDLARSAFARRGWVPGEPLNDEQLGERLDTFLGASDSEEKPDA
ncbi:hypothetical protein F9C11_20425 [Amycolatopsis sp. VS8301801F10]|uniref:hypothetical protein n=1 Tax=unclassified Amycolatopsis TaxID=2618356 RepID=UPI0038FD3BBE